jgi:hypothetical protein
MKNQNLTNIYTPKNFYKNLIGSIIFLPLGAWLYAYALWYIPIVFLRFISIALLFLGIAPIKALLDFNIIRNKIFLSILGVFLGIMSLYLSWAIWLNLAQNLEGYTSFLVFDFPITHANYAEILRLFTNTDELFSLIYKIGKIGTWGVRGSTISGFLLYTIWFIELLIVAFGTLKMVNDTTMNQEIS